MLSKMRFSIFTYILVTLAIVLNVAQSEEHIRVKRRMYAMCPPNFHRIGSECYFVSESQASWMEAHFNCKDKNSKLSEPNVKVADRKIRTYLKRNDSNRDAIWIGATFDGKSQQWQWSNSGKNLTYDAFSETDARISGNLEYQCAVLDPSLKYRWSSRSCVEKHRYICQHKMPKVSQKNREKVYNRWNQTYPDELANEVILEIVDTSENGSRTHRRVRPVDDGHDEITIPVRPIKRRRRPNVPAEPSSYSTTTPPSYVTNEISPVFVPRHPFYLPSGPAEPLQEIPKTHSTRAPRPRHRPVPISSVDNETVQPENPPAPAEKKKPRRRTDFDIKIGEKRRLELQRRRKMRQQKQLKERQEKEQREAEQKRQEENRIRQEQERMRQEQERMRQEEERIRQDRERARQEEAEKTRREQQEKLDALKRQLKEEEEKNRVAEMEKQKKLESLRAAENEQNMREDDEEVKRLELEELAKARRREQEELARIEEETRKREEVQRAREAKIREQEEAMRRQEQEEKQIQERLKWEREERARLEEEERQRTEQERKDKEERERLERERDEERRRRKELEKKKIEAEKDTVIEQQMKEAERKKKLSNMRARFLALSPEEQHKFLERKRLRAKNKKRNSTSTNEATIPE